MEEMVDWAKFFKSVEDHRVRAGFYGCDEFFTVEDLYQAFKARLEHERKMECYGDEQS